MRDPTSGPGRLPAWDRWRAAMLLGLISSSFSTLISQALAGRIGRDAVVDWMVVAAIPLGNQALQIEPAAGVVLVGILFHQWADFSWEVTFFGLLGRWTASLPPGRILMLAVPWAVFTSATEWLVLVPLFPFFQPVFPLEQPYWIGLLVHLSSGLMYPLFPWLRDWVAGRSDPDNSGFAKVWGGLAVGGLAVLGGLGLLGWQGRELPWMGANSAAPADQAFIRRMTAHHVQGTELATLAAGRAADPYLRQIARLMAAEQIGEIRILDQWWRSWFAVPPEICGPDERAAMPGMLEPSQVAELRQHEGAAFDARFVVLMTAHHRGAVVMADQQMHGDGDIRLRIMAQAIRHAQQGEIAMMHHMGGLMAVRAAIANQFSTQGTP